MRLIKIEFTCNYELTLLLVLNKQVCETETFSLCKKKIQGCSIYVYIYTYMKRRRKKLPFGGIAILVPSTIASGLILSLDRLNDCFTSLDAISLVSSSVSS